ncbi:MerR family transcriptional regulator [Parerythrobacter aestuarii]|uniref:MerR family transcriptional regulator n=1 Tax=Parerythrobacter aestuarii TaxID=3020909 RepID=UPI0024DE9768|nr:MerR family transcriptional regulator [Parerythrobacter aestuarii]
MTTFDDGKDEGALRTIGEVGNALGLKPHVLRYWEEQFPMLQPLKRSGNRRYYRPEDVALVETIDRLVNHEGYTLKGARQAITEGKVEPVPSLEQSVDGRGAIRDTSPVQAQTGPEVEGDENPNTVAPEILRELKEIRRNLADAIGA